MKGWSACLFDSAQSGDRVGTSLVTGLETRGGCHGQYAGFCSVRAHHLDRRQRATA
ncbi:hypothetical protein BN2476_1450007 [Paraburkholderia piptadeniae]|uniref:Uncharacterized protein n=1 Tax=Paraburkholderia piptadeniae TaxID=1701573 RepID=A0A1N7SWU7_9BURK|nr:hypothetical protein BN2476_1450007 [Paraburkholderia piptadeniae]